MRTAQRHNLRAAAAILSVSILGLLLSVPLCFGPGALTYLSQRAVIGVLGPSILLILNAFMLVDAVLFDATRRLALCIFLGVVTWPLAALSMSGISVAAMWKLACRYPKTVHSDISNYENILNAESCSDGDADSAVVAFLTGDWRLWAAWVGAVLVFSMANALLASAIPARKEVFGNMRQMEFRQRVAKRRDEESGDGPVNADDIQIPGGRESNNFRHSDSRPAGGDGAGAAPAATLAEVDRLRRQLASANADRDRLAAQQQQREAAAAQAQAAAFTEADAAREAEERSSMAQRMARLSFQASQQSALAASPSGPRGTPRGTAHWPPPVPSNRPPPPPQGRMALHRLD